MSSATASQAFRALLPATVLDCHILAEAFGEPYHTARPAGQLLATVVLFQTQAPQPHPFLLAGTEIQAERFGFVCPVLYADTLGATASFRYQLPPSPAPCWTGRAKR